jgi:glycosyltransferase involved in cell wall biosynthesis
MRVLHIIESLDAGGAERVLFNIIHFNQDSEIEHAVLCLASEGALGEEFKKNNIEVKTLNKKLGFDPRLFHRAHQVFKEWQPDLLHCHLFSGNLWGRLFSILFSLPSVMSVQNADSWISGWRSLAEIILAPVPRLTIAASETALTHRKKFGLKEKHSVVLNNGTSSEAAAPGSREKLRAGWGVSENDFVVGVLARCVPQKDPRLFLSIANQLLKKNKNLHFVWAGGGDAIPSNLPSRVLFLGHQNNTMEVLAAYDTLLSTSEREGFSLSLIEGMISALPVLATRVPGNVEMFSALNAELLSEGDSLNWFVEKLQAWIDEPEKAKKVGRELKEKVLQEFSAQSMSSAYHECYRKLNLG